MANENNYLYNLQETQEIVDNCDGESDSTLCSNCPCTEYGTEKNYSNNPNFGMTFCEGSHCETAIENVEDDLISEYNYRKKELAIMERANMSVNIDLGVLEQNVVKMVADRIEEETISALSSKIMSKVEKTVLENVNKMVDEKVKSITEGDIYNVEIEIDDKKVKLFDFMIQQLIGQAKSKSVEFSDTIEDLVQGIEYTPATGGYVEDDFKVLTTYTNDEYGSTESITVSINGEDVFGIGSGEPEDMTINRNLNDALDVPDLIKRAYLAGKAGKIMYEASETSEE